MSRTSKNRKNLPKYTQQMWKDAGHQARKASQVVFIGEKEEMEGEYFNFDYAPIAKHRRSYNNLCDDWDDIMKSFYLNKANWLYPIETRFFYPKHKYCVILSEQLNKEYY
jgi:hypothetical protein